ncbi:methyl-accepting chemotaxis protein [Rhizobium sp. LjRoot254]|uniref:methyl-accepting chemotaxis protein n=1 Tax=Rhizobium sp. LjRoot254 TaxID=3342297 RepID=UPI003ECF2696
MLFKSATGRNIFAIAASGLVATLATAGVLFTIAYKDSEEASLEQMRQIASNNALGIEKSMAQGMQTVDNLKSTLTAMKLGGNADRASADRLLETLLKDNKMALGVWTGWDPNAFDGKDAEFVGKKGHDKTGRYVPYWVKSGDKIIVEALVDYTVPGAGDYYILAHSQKKAVVIEPYIYPINGKPELITTLVTAILLDGKSAGVAGMDISLASANEALSAIRPMGDGFLSLVTGAGNIVAHPVKELAGKPIKDAGEMAMGWDKLMANPGVVEETTLANGETYLSVAYAVKLTADNNWYAVVSIPKNTVFAGLYHMAWMAAAVTAIAAILLAGLGLLISRRFIGRISNVIGQTDRIAKGDLDVVLSDADKKDEIGDLSRSLAMLLENNRHKVELEAQAHANQAQQEKEREDRARITSAQEEEVRFAVTELAGGLKQLSDGDMTIRLEKPFTGALEQIRNDFNGSIEKLREALVSFSENAATIESGSKEIRSAADDLSRRTEQQAASVEETAAALEQITTSVKDSTTRAEEAGSLVAKTKDGAEKSGEVVRNAVAAMSEIERSSQSISNIIGVIDEIAFQTNLLALNAGVEAARAGEAGKGFAVVAQEVRELAQRSANAAKEIKGLITSSGDHVKRGVSLVGETGQALEMIVVEVQQINSNVQAIVQAAREQSIGLQEINTAVNQMDQGTQQNAAMVEETNAAAHTLATEVSSLSNRLGQFNLGGRTANSRVEPVRHSQPVAARPAAIRPASAPVRIAPAAVSRAVPAASPARALGNKLAAAFPAASAPSGGEWEEF